MQNSFRPLLHAGFTLVELLVVLVIMGIALGMVTLQLMPDARSELRNEADRLALLLENAGLEARSSGRSLAWSAEKNSYRFWRKNDYGDWAQIVGDEQLRSRTLPEGIYISTVTVDAQPIKAGEYLTLNAATFPTSFNITLNNPSSIAHIIGKSTGEVSAQLGVNHATSQ